MTHLNALQVALSNERSRLANAKTAGERELRAVWVRQLEKEVAAEEINFPACDLSDDELLAELGA